MKAELNDVNSGQIKHTGYARVYIEMVQKRRRLFLLSRLIASLCICASTCTGRGCIASVTSERVFTACCWVAMYIARKLT